MVKFLAWWQSAVGSAARAGLLVALVGSYGLVMAAQLASEVGAYFPAVYVLTAFLAALGTLALGGLELPLAIGPDLAVAGWLFYLLVLARGLTLGDLYALLAVAALLAFLLVRLNLAGRLLQGIPPCIRSALPAALGVMLVLWGAEEGRLLLASPTHLVMLGDFADPLAFFSLLGLLVLLGLRAIGLGWLGALGGGLGVTAILTFLEGFWVWPTAPFYEPEGLERAAGLLLLAGAEAGDAAAFGRAALALPWLVLVLLLGPYGASAAILPEASGADGEAGRRRKSFLSAITGLNFLAALAGVAPLTVATESALGISDGRRATCSRAFTRGAAVGLALLALLLPLARELASFPAMLVPLIIGAGILLVWRARIAWASYDFAERMAALALLLVVPLTYNIALGLGLSLTLYALLKVLAGEGRQIPSMTRVFAALFVALVYFDSWLI